jgi:hypothetical protein
METLSQITRSDGCQELRAGEQRCAPCQIYPVPIKAPNRQSSLKRVPWPALDGSNRTARRFCNAMRRSSTRFRRAMLVRQNSIARSMVHHTCFVYLLHSIYRRRHAQISAGGSEPVAKGRQPFSDLMALDCFSHVRRRWRWHDCLDGAVNYYTSFPNGHPHYRDFSSTSPCNNFDRTLDTAVQNPTKEKG